jgi:hypothetical protein
VLAADVRETNVRDAKAAQILWPTDGWPSHHAFSASGPSLPIQRNHLQMASISFCAHGGNPSAMMV